MLRTWWRQLHPKRPTGHNPYSTGIEGYVRRNRRPLRQGIMNAPTAVEFSRVAEKRAQEGRSQFKNSGRTVAHAQAVGLSFDFGQSPTKRSPLRSATRSAINIVFSSWSKKPRSSSGSATRGDGFADGSRQFKGASGHSGFRISKFRMNFPAIAVPTINCRGLGTIRE